MSRPFKFGLEYFPLDVNFFEDDKIQLISSEFGIKGEIVAIRLLCKIYDNGYYYKWSKDQSLLLSKNTGIDLHTIELIISSLLERDFFDKSLFEKFSILTSRGIQKRFIEAASRRKEVIMIQEFLLIQHDVYNNPAHIKLTGINVYNNSINVDNNSINANINPQSKVKKSKVKDSKVKQSKVKNLASKNIFDDEIDKLCIKAFKETPNIFIKEKIISLINEYGFYEIEKIFKEAAHKGFFKISTLLNSLDSSNGKLKIMPKENKILTTPTISSSDIEGSTLLNDLLNIFCVEYEKVNETKFEIINYDKELNAINKILEIYLNKNKYNSNGLTSNDEIKKDFKNFFNACLNINDKWLKNNMSPNLIINKFNEINLILRNNNGKSNNINGTSGNKSEGGATVEGILRAIEKTWGSSNLPNN